MNDGTYEGILNQDDVQEYVNGDNAIPFYPERAETVIRADNGAEVAKLQKEIDELRAAVIETCPRLVNESDADCLRRNVNVVTVRFERKKMTDEEKIKWQERYNSAAHAMQSGVAQDHALGSRDGSPKHLRVGVNSALVNQAALAKLLIDKGIITEDEYLIAVVEAMEDEVRRYEDMLTEAMSVSVHLG